MTTRGDKMSWWEIDVWHSVVDVYGCWEMDSIWHIAMHLNQESKVECSWDMEPCGFTHMVDALMGVLFKSLPS